MNSSQIHTFKMVEEILDTSNFIYSNCIDGETWIWYSDDIRVEYHEDETIIFYDEQEELKVLSNSNINSEKITKENLLLSINQIFG